MTAPVTRREGAGAPAAMGATAQPDALSTAPDASAPDASAPDAVTPEVSTPDAATAGWTRSQRLVLAGIGVTLFAVYTTYSWARHAKFETTGFDLGIFDQVVRAYAHFHAPTSPLKGVGFNIMGDHFHPILVLLVPLYWIWDDPRMLLAAQSALFAVSIVPVAAFARRRFGGWASLFVACAYGASWPIEQAVHFDFHEIAFAVPLLALLVDALDRRAYRTVLACCALLLLVREDMGALLVVVGLLIALRPPRPGHARRPEVLLGVGLLTAGLVGYWVTTALIIPAFAATGFSYWTFTALGPDPMSALETSLRHPLRVARLMVRPEVKFDTLVTIFYPTGFLALVSPYVLLTAPFLAERMLNDRKFLWETNFHYTSVVAPLVMLAAVDTLDRLVRALPRLVRSPQVRRVQAGLVAAFLAWGVGVVAWQFSTQSPDYPITGLVNGRVFSRGPHWEAVDEVLGRIPAGECVEADNRIAPHLTPRDYVTRVASRQVPGSGGLATWIVLDLARVDTGWQGDAPQVALAASLRRGYVEVWRKNKVVLLHKDQPVAPLCRGLY